MAFATDMCRLCAGLYLILHPKWSELRRSVSRPSHFHGLGSGLAVKRSPSLTQFTKIFLPLCSLVEVSYPQFQIDEWAVATKMLLWLANPLWHLRCVSFSCQTASHIHTYILMTAVKFVKWGSESRRHAVIKLPYPYTNTVGVGCQPPP
jgi:hypothetical protein